jgi:hypothetical protein
LATNKVAVRDWERLQQDIESVGEKQAAQIHGYLSVDSMRHSIHNHERRVHMGITNGGGPTFHEKFSQAVSTAGGEIPEFVINRNFQRPDDDHRQRMMATKWEWLACGTIAVSLREVDGENVYSVIDGQQRLGAIRLQGYKEAPCRVYVDLTEPQEALLYELLNQAKKPNYNDLFKSRLSRGEEVAEAINTAVKQVGYQLDVGRTRSKNHFRLNSMRELERIYVEGGGRQSGVVAIMDTLKLYKELYATEEVQQPAMVVTGIAAFLRNYMTSKVSRPELITKLRKKGLTKTVQLAFQWAAVHGGGSGSNSRAKVFAEAMVIVYNENRQEGNKIHSKYF